MPAIRPRKGVETLTASDKNCATVQMPTYCFYCKQLVVVYEDGLRARAVHGGHGELAALWQCPVCDTTNALRGLPSYIKARLEEI